MTFLWSYTDALAAGDEGWWRVATRHTADLLEADHWWLDPPGLVPVQHLLVETTALLSYALARSQDGDPDTVTGAQLAAWAAARPLPMLDETVPDSLEGSISLMQWSKIFEQQQLRQQNDLARLLEAAGHRLAPRPLPLPTTYPPPPSSPPPPSAGPPSAPPFPGSGSGSADPATHPPCHDPGSLPPTGDRPPFHDPGRLPPTGDPANHPPFHDPGRLPPTGDRANHPPFHDPGRLPPAGDPAARPAVRDPVAALWEDLVDRKNPGRRYGPDSRLPGPALALGLGAVVQHFDRA
ncbi:hypothetical protein BJY16_003637 [Actinoplanes octamycinicus]|uniref:Uncharacterized protein n=1 Tax=Actinoplanes octamycinicus TaxID=135948 RepID=A0A7W7M7U4_9ACTN|nr:hypothetical protein [Actinoplanes octamycinicus]MBB4740178.1 hypothetical protein [Actinoplanes octamycinicus]GIE59575.1 hypothetical protein Aoc01nite_49770 [Actinoplanes octamycinicus]